MRLFRLAPIVLVVSWLAIVPSLPAQRYIMASDTFAPKLTGGAYDSSALDRKAQFTGNRYQKDRTVAARYDFRPMYYLQPEQHLLDGTLIKFSSSNNPNGLTETSCLTLAKQGVTF